MNGSNMKLSDTAMATAMSQQYRFYSITDCQQLQHLVFILLACIKSCLKIGNSFNDFKVSLEIRSMIRRHFKIYLKQLEHYEDQ